MGVMKGNMELDVNIGEKKFVIRSFPKSKLSQEEIFLQQRDVAQMHKCSNIPPK